MGIVRDYPSAAYCVQVCVLFLVSMSTMCFIFVPKFIQVHVLGGETKGRGTRRITEIERIRERASMTNIEGMQAALKSVNDEEMNVVRESQARSSDSQTNVEGNRVPFKSVN